MNFQSIIKNLSGVCLSAVLLLNLNGCSTRSENSSVELGSGPVKPSSSFSSSAVCANNSFLQKYQCSFTRIEEAARSGDPDAQYALGYLYYYGIGTTQDRQTGLIWIKKAAAQGQSVAQEALKALSTSPKPAVKKVSGSATSAASTSQNTTQTTTGGRTQAEPEKPLTDYLPNYGEKRIDSTATPPSVNLSNPPTTQNQ